MLNFHPMMWTLYLSYDLQLYSTVNTNKKNVIFFWDLITLRMIFRKHAYCHQSKHSFDFLHLQLVSYTHNIENHCFLSTFTN